MKKTLMIIAGLWIAGFAVMGMTKANAMHCDTKCFGVTNRCETYCE
jgi:hypothetical protein